MQFQVICAQSTYVTCKFHTSRAYGLGTDVIGCSAATHLDCFGVAAGGFFGDSAGLSGCGCRGGVVV